jgi:hypothetical protein
MDVGHQNPKMHTEVLELGTRYAIGLNGSHV